MTGETHIRVRVTTRDRLRDLAAAMVASHAAGHAVAISPDPDPINPRCTGIALDVVLTRLLDHYELYLARRERSNARRKHRKGGEG